MARPWHVLIALGASLVMATVLFLLVHVSAVFRVDEESGTRPPFAAAYRGFLTAFWWTAPLAWFYAVPYERFLPHVEAIGMNLWTLAFVATWRVVLMIRVVSVLWGIRVWNASLLVLLFADAIVLAVVNYAPGPVLQVMGGLRYSEADTVVAELRMLVGFLAAIVAPFLVLLGLVAITFLYPRWHAWVARRTVSMRAPIRVAAAAMLVWVPILPFTQPEQRLRTRAEDVLARDGLAAGMRFLSAYERSDLPPHWDPPPRPAFFPGDRSFDEVCAALRSAEPAAWVRDLYLARVELGLRYLLAFERSPSWGEILDEERKTPASAEPEAHAFDAADIGALELLLEGAALRSAEERAALRGLLELRRGRVEATGTPGGG